MIPLTCPMIIALEQRVLDSDCLPDATIAGQTLFCLYSRARWSDAQNLVSMEIDGPVEGDYFLQACVWKTKTSSVTGHRHQFLPMVALVMVWSVTGVESGWRRGSWRAWSLEKTKPLSLFYLLHGNLGHRYEDGRSNQVAARGALAEGVWSTSLAASWYP